MIHGSLAPNACWDDDANRIIMAVAESAKAAKIMQKWDSNDTTTYVSSQEPHEILGNGDLFDGTARNMDVHWR